MEKKFKPFDKVIARFRDKNWMCDLYSHYNPKINRHVTLGFCDLEDDCILPYEGNEHLVGTTNSPDEEVKLEEGEWIMYSFGGLVSIHPLDYNLGKFIKIIDKENNIEVQDSDSVRGSSKFIRFSDFNPNDMEATKSKILCVKNGRIIRYKG